MFRNIPQNKGFPIEHLLFVYGTLMKGHRNHVWMEELIQAGHSEFVSDEAVCKNLGIVDIGGLPAVYNIPTRVVAAILKTDKVVSIRTNGDLYRLSIPGLEYLDMLEGHPHFYNRKLTTIRIPPDRKERHSMVYLGPTPKRRHGDPDGVYIGDLLHTPNRYGLSSEYEGKMDRTPLRILENGNIIIQENPA